MAGELEDGTSPFDTIAVDYINKAYMGLLAGGNLFGYDTDEPWIWAQSKRPILSALQAYIDTTIAVTADSVSGTLGAAQSQSVEGWYAVIEGFDDVYNIAANTSGNTAVSLDQAFLGASGTYNCKLIKLDYELIDDTIIINSKNCVIDFNQGGASLTATLTKGSYTPSSLCTEIKTRMDAAGSNVYTVTFNSITRKFKITISSGTTLNLSFASGSNAYISASEVLGYDCLDYSGATYYESSYSLNSILRLTKPISMYRTTPYQAEASADSNKIFLIDDNSFLRDYPISRMILKVPDKFCVVQRDKNDLWTVRMNSFVDEEVRFEVGYIPVHRKLQDNTSSFPVLPSPNIDFLVYAAAYFLMLDKSDSKADRLLQMAQAQLKALVNDNRKGLALGGNNFGKLIPRPSQTNRYGGWW
jgi:hypothetical protein